MQVHPLGSILLLEQELGSLYGLELTLELGLLLELGLGLLFGPRVAPGAWTAATTGAETAGAAGVGLMLALQWVPKFD